MRRVVVTGLGMVTPLGCGVEPTWKNLIEGKSGASKVKAFDVSDLACKIACSLPRGDGTDGTFNPDQWMEPKEQRKVDPFIVYAMAAATQALDDAGWKPTTYEDQCASGVLIGSGIGGIGGIYDASVTLAGARPAAHFPVLHPRPPDQPRRRLRLHRARAQGPEQRGRHRLLDGLARDRRRLAADRPRRCRRHGGRRSGIADQPALARRLRRLPGALDRLQRRADEGLASLRQGPRRLRHGRRRRRRRARGVRARQGAGREDLCRGDRLRPVGRRLSHHLADRGRRRRLPLHGGRHQARRHLALRTSTTSTPTAPRRRSATRSS